MIRSFHTVALVCDARGFAHFPQEGKADFYGPTEKEALAVAESAGWLVGSALAICPACVRKLAIRDSDAPTPPF